MCQKWHISLQKLPICKHTVKSRNMKHSLLLLLLCIPFLSAFPQQIDGELYNLTKMKNGYRSKRISSYDKNGYNGDRIVGIKPNEKS